MAELIDFMVDEARVSADEFMIENGLISCWVAADHNGDVWVYGSAPRLIDGSYWSVEDAAKKGVAQKAKRVFRFPFTIKSPQQLITEMCR